MAKTMRWEPRLRLGTAGLALALLMGGAGCDDDDPPPPGPKDGAIDASTSDAAKDGSSPDAVVSETASPDGGAGDVASSEVGDGGSADGGGETAPPPPDIAYALVRLTATGQVDSTFGSNGIARFPLGSGSGSLSNPALYSIAKDAQDRVVLFGVKRAPGRTDADRVVMRLTPAGQIDTTFGTAGEVSHSIGTLN